MNPSTVSSPPTARRRGRRALLSTAGGLVAVGAVAGGVPLAIRYGRHALALEIANLEGIAIDVASQSADATYQAVNLIVNPVADVVSYISADSLDALKAGLDQVKAIPGLPTDTRNALQAFESIIAAWRINVALFPATVRALDAVPRDAARKYLADLKQKQHQEAEQTF